ncbi:MAG TPA: SOS response-associated peptidase [Vicinamibacteria bacterium]|nr:SOS response-associated peptidase [Vicinamibacteria bacterium]
MCNRFALPASPEELAEQFGLSELPPLVPRYNVAPGEEILVVRAEGDRRLLQHACWGFRPRGRDRLLLNIRAETLRARGRPRHTRRRERVLVPAGGFFEWRHVGRARQPFYFKLKDGPLLGFAALCEDAAAGQVRRCALLTTAPNPLVAEVHDRMPAILARDAYARWLDAGADLVDVLGLLQPFPAEAMTGYPVSTLVNRSGVEDPRAIEPARQQTLF